MYWPTTSLTDLTIYLTEDAVLDWKSRTYTDADQVPGQPSKFPWKVLDESDVKFGDYTDERIKEVEIVCSERLQTNGTLYAHIFLTRTTYSPNATSNDFDDQMTTYVRKPLTRFQPKRKVAKLKSLIKTNATANDPSAASPTTEEEDVVDSKEPQSWIAFWHPNVTISVVPENQVLQLASLPPPIVKHIRPASDGVHYYPVLFVNDFWLMQEHMYPINGTIKSLPLRLDFYQTAWWKYMMYMQMEESFKAQEAMGNGKSEIDEIKRMLIETNPILLGITMVVTALHSVFDMLAFKNDIQFWRARKDLEGLSLRTIVSNIVVQVIIFLYLLDNETSWVVIMSSGMGAAIEIWKVHKAVEVERLPSFPFIKIKERVTNKRVTKTQEYDKIAFTYLSYAFVPLMIGYAIYSLVYEQHKSWYSYVLGTLVGFVYTFGFITMTPQLYINYRLKSVAHMPWKTFMYKALNTFIDDLFAFIIKMPTLHRLACFRDDIIFVIYLYQRWVYPEDKRRRNEFGQVGDACAEEEDEDDIEDKLLAEKEEKEKSGATGSADAGAGAPERKKDK
ncbi:cleft lip and palate transmembrane 1 [Gonapodya prolifera JEL478]|uniref:Cleft lip and palate transmembrane 1 n=1 Tax=Gonapodya prolifera (strain JEL478) TaxID=1344416 RepID=A0A139A9E9_GONPJ|nr:cleft lip and palate transmembrane 1 [Gonapodya prolifera JEL478]|eukprot:KXS13023.1 cleft lip and palate transmembrane 1 [Gonapodya prolifera JEL478]